MGSRLDRAQNSKANEATPITRDALLQDTAPITHYRLTLTPHAKVAYPTETVPAMAPTLPSFNPARLRSYLFRLPLFTRIIILFILFFWIVELQSAWNVTQWGALVPAEVSLGTSMFNLASSESKVTCDSFCRIRNTAGELC